MDDKYSVYNVGFDILLPLYDGLTLVQVCVDNERVAFFLRGLARLKRLRQDVKRPKHTYWNNSFVKSVLPTRVCSYSGLRSSSVRHRVSRGPAPSGPFVAGRPAGEGGGGGIRPLPEILTGASRRRATARRTRMRTNDDARSGRLRVCGRDTNGSGRQHSTAPVDGVLPERWCRATPSVALLSLSLSLSLALSLSAVAFAIQLRMRSLRR